MDLSSLNLNQRRAIDWDGGPLLVLAGPGSGKTRVLTMRVAKLLADSPDASFRVLGLTFTNKAAAEMRTRVNELVPPEVQDRALLTTFHSFCADVLRQHGSHLGLRPDFKILNQQADREAVLLDAIVALRERGWDFQDGDVRILPVLDACLDDFVPDDQVASRIRDKETGRKAATLYTEYRQQLLLQNCVDYPSLLLLAYRLLKDRPAIAKQLRIIYHHVCVDEFQDTNCAQCEILRLIAGNKPKHLFVVADDDQIIYQWNGASPQRLFELRAEYNMEIIQLPTNYRCPPEVIRLANNLIQYNLSRSPDKEPLSAAKPDDGQQVVRAFSFGTLDEELDWVAADIESRGSVEWGKCVVLGRNKSLLGTMVRALSEIGLKAAIAVRKDEFQSAPFRWLHAILRLTNARRDREQLRRVCKSFYDLEGVDIRVEQVVTAASLDNDDYLRPWFAEVFARSELEPDTRLFLCGAEKDLLDQGDYLRFMDLTFNWFDAVSRRPGMVASDALADYEEESGAWQDLLKATLEKYGRDQTSLQIFLQEFDLSPKSPPIPPDAVRCYTIHSSKGMEFPHVYLIGLVEDVLPSYQSLTKGVSSLEVQEERRNCFVAITRTQLTLTLTCSRQHGRWDRQPSRFLTEMGFMP